MLVSLDGDALEIISEAYDMWYMINDVEDEFTNNGLTYESKCNIPTLWDLRDLILEICMDNNIRTVWYHGVPIIRHEFVDYVNNIMDLELMEYLSGDLYIVNQAQQILIEELL